MAICNPIVPSLTELTVLRRAQDDMVWKLGNLPTSAPAVLRVHYGTAVADPRHSVRLIGRSETAPKASRHAVISRVGFGGGCRSRA